jgi:hypothetical protein
MDADIEFIQKELNKSSETENKDFAENKVCSSLRYTTRSPHLSNLFP